MKDTRGGYKMSKDNLMEVFDEKQALYAQYEELLLRRDQLYKEAESFLIEYTAIFGDLIVSNFQLKIECIKKKKTISYCRRRLNRGLPIDTKRMQAEIEEEMKLYYAQLQEMIDDTERARKAETIGAYRYERAKKIYRRLAKLIHPDINPKTMDNEILRDLWTRITEAYRHSDVNALDDLEVLVHKALEEMGDTGVEPASIPDLEDRIDRVERQINDIINTEPYIYGDILYDEEKKQEVKDRLQAEHDDYEEYLAILTKNLEDMLREGGATLVWEMK